MKRYYRRGDRVQAPLSGFGLLSTEQQLVEAESKIAMWQSLTFVFMALYWFSR